MSQLGDENKTTTNNTHIKTGIHTINFRMLEVSAAKLKNLTKNWGLLPALNATTEEPQT